MTVRETLRAVRENVETLIRETAPNHPVEADSRFTLHDGDRPIEEMPGPSRLFCVGGEVSQNRPYSLGHTTIHDVVDMPITFVYEASQPWREAAIDDMREIVKQLRITTPAISGCARRLVHDGQQNQTIQSPDGDWEYHTLTLSVYLSV